jgi:hypothetical protein
VVRKLEIDEEQKEMGLYIVTTNFISYKYTQINQEITKDNLQAFIQQFKQNKLQPYNKDYYNSLIDSNLNSQLDQLR